MPSRDRIISLLGQGLSAEVVATAVGCDPSYISQLISDEETFKQIAELRVQHLQAATDRDNKWNQVEDKLLDKLIDSVGYVIKPREILASLAVVNKAKRRGATAQESVTINNTVVNLSLPQKVLQQLNFITNTSNQVIGINDKSLLTIPTQNIKALANQALPSLDSHDKITSAKKPNAESSSREESAKGTRVGIALGALTAKDF